MLVAALLALAMVLIELGALAVELKRRGRRDRAAVKRAARAARTALAAGDRAGAGRELVAAASSQAMHGVFAALLEQLAGPEPLDSNALSKDIADFDLGSLQRLERTRLLVRAGPALGLMGTLIPLSPALSGLASGNIKQLTDNLRVAFSVTVLGLLIGVIAFGISLVRDRMYAQDLSDVEFIAAELEAAVHSAPVQGGSA
ncbi:MAG TPA: MotA/TolQ/ExbB proton channel family protein [Solirubrobacteraceae bacterium]